jgi:hypothetical protein
LANDKLAVIAESGLQRTQVVMKSLKLSISLVAALFACALEAKSDYLSDVVEKTRKLPKYTAIAESWNNGYTYYAYQYESVPAAKQAALSGCNKNSGSGNCKIIFADGRMVAQPKRSFRYPAKILVFDGVSKKLQTLTGFASESDVFATSSSLAVRTSSGKTICSGSRKRSGNYITITATCLGATYKGTHRLGTKTYKMQKGNSYISLAVSF